MTSMESTEIGKHSVTVPAHRELRVGNLNTIVNEVAQVVGVFGRPCGKRYSGDRVIATLAPYPEMRDSGLAGLGEVPEHWDVRRLKNVCRLNYGDSLGANSRSGGTVAVFGSNGQIGWHNVANTKDPCIVVGRKGSFGKINYVEDSVFAIDTTFFVDERSSTADLRWLYYSLEWLGLDKVTKDSAIPGLDRQDAYTRRLVTPPRSEQTDIARFLDDADRRIHRYIRSKEQLIELLEEQKQVIIHQAVTGRIDVRTGQPYPAYKESGAEWLGEVPEHWGIVPLKWLSRRTQNGITPPTASPAYYENGTVPWYGPSSCGPDEEVGHPVKQLTPAAFSHGVARIVTGPAILVVVIGATAGRMALMLNEGSSNQQITAYETETSVVCPRFLLRQLRLAENWLRSTASSATLPILNSNVVDRLRCAVPPSAERDSIDGFLRAHIGSIDRSLARAGQQIHLLREYRTRLIADVVTGKLDVREAAAKLPVADPLGGGN